MILKLNYKPDYIYGTMFESYYYNKNVVGYSFDMTNKRNQLYYFSYFVNKAQDIEYDNGLIRITKLKAVKVRGLNYIICSFNEKVYL